MLSLRGRLRCRNDISHRGESLVFLSDIVIAIIAIALTVFFGLRLYFPVGGADVARDDGVAPPLAAVLLFAFIVLLSTRDFAFGVDTLTYANIFQAYCTDSNLRDMEFGYRFTSAILNVVMLGACDVRLLPLAWLGCLGLGLKLVAGNGHFQLAVATTLATSVVGVELASNALRQSLAVVLLVAAASRARRQPLAAAHRAAGWPVAWPVRLAHGT